MWPTCGEPTEIEFTAAHGFALPLSVRYWVNGRSAYTVDLSAPQVQDWYIQRMSAFMTKTGSGGWAWDHDIYAGPANLRYLILLTEPWYFKPT